METGAQPPPQLTDAPATRHANAEDLPLRLTGPGMPIALGSRRNNRCWQSRESA